MDPTPGELFGLTTLINLLVEEVRDRLIVEVDARGRGGLLDRDKILDQQ